MLDLSFVRDNLPRVEEMLRQRGMDPAAVLKDFRPKELWVGLLPPSRALDNLIAEADALGIKVVRRWEGDRFNLGGARFDVLFPPKDWPR